MCLCISPIYLIFDFCKCISLIYLRFDFCLCISPIYLRFDLCLCISPVYLSFDFCLCIVPVYLSFDLCLCISACVPATAYPLGAFAVPGPCLPRAAAARRSPGDLPEFHECWLPEVQLSGGPGSHCLPQHARSVLSWS